MKKYTTKRVAAIGDGGNDVSMIQEANLGIGIVGKEGKQASLAADYSITRFDRINGLIFWYGRLAYKNTACISHFVIHRGLIISFIQYIFSIFFYGQPIPIYNGNLILGYTSIYTALPVISLLLDEDVPQETALKFPNLYRNIQKGRELSIKMFLVWFTISLYQATAIMIGSIYFFKDDIYLKLVTVSFTTLVMLELLNVYAEVIK
jgi:phospholipid-translocating ATPase